MSIRFFDPKNEINFVKLFKPMLAVAAMVPIVAVVGSLVFGINWGIDFKGGAEMQVTFHQQDPSDEDIIKVLTDAGFEKHRVQRYDDAAKRKRLISVERLATFAPEDVPRIEGVVKSAFPNLKQDAIKVSFDIKRSDRLEITLPVAADMAAQRAELTKVLDKKALLVANIDALRKDDTGSNVGSVVPGEVKSDLVTYDAHFISVGDLIATALKAKFGQIDIDKPQFVDSQISDQLRTDGFLAVMFALLAILIYIAIRFDFFFAPGAIVALIQDTFGAFMVFVVARYEFDLPSVAALLTVLGVSINNTIVVYDRIRETMPHDPKKPVDDATVTAAVNKAVNDTLSRTINTTLTTVIASVCLWWFAGGVISSFAAVLTIGLSLGALSSTFAAPATYLFMRRRYGHLISARQAGRGQSREDKLKGVV
jgi:preprotein translocase subunit SecF